MGGGSRRRDSSREEGHIDMAAERMQPRGLCPGPNGLDQKDKRYASKILIFILEGKSCNRRDCGH